MKIFVFNGPKAINGVFTFIFAFIILYFGFFSEIKAVTVSSEPMKTTYLAIIIDDFGNDTDGTKEFMYMEAPFTGAVMPSMPHSYEEGKQLYENNKDVILHLPMEPVNGKRSWLPDKAILSQSTEDEAKEVVHFGLDEIRYCVGINNHMGSKVMEDEKLLRAVLEVAKEKNLVFVDSGTTNKSKARDIGEEMGITVLQRDIFLDGTKDVSKIEKNLKKAANIAMKKGYAVAIGHVGQEGGKATASAIKNTMPYFEENNVQLITISELIKIIQEGLV